MATIIGAIASSHTPTIGFARDWKQPDDPVWGPIFAAYEPIRKWLAEKKPDAIVVTYNDHVTSFFFDHYSAFALGIDREYAVADEGGGARELPPVPGHAKLAHHIGQSLMADEFDMSFFQGKPLDHGVLSPMSMLLPADNGWACPIVPLQIGVLQFPIPTAKRCYALGKALRRAIESYPEDLKVVVIGTGGLSHQVHGERAGFNNTPWDLQFLELIEKDPEALTRMTQAEYAKLGGMEGAEVIMWLVMRGTLASSVKKVHQTYYLPSMTGIATAIYENEAPATPVDALAAHRRHMGAQLAGAETLEGTYPFTLERSVKSFRLNRFLHRLTEPAHREKFLADEAATLAASDLTREEQAMVKGREWQKLIRYGASFFMLEKLGAVVGVSNLHIYAAMRGQSLEDFQKTRNTQVLYSVAGQDASRTTWDSDSRDSSGKS